MSEKMLMLLIKRGRVVSFVAQRWSSEEKRLRYVLACNYLENSWMLSFEPVWNERNANENVKRGGETLREAPLEKKPVKLALSVKFSGKVLRTLISTFPSSFLIWKRTGPCYACTFTHRRWKRKLDAGSGKTITHPTKWRPKKNVRPIRSLT